MSRMAIKLAHSDDVALGELTSSIGFLLRLAQVKVFDEFFENPASHDLKPGEFSVLWVIALNPGLKQGVLAERLCIKAAHMTKLVQRLVKADLVHRSIPEHDRRSVHLALTDKGRSFVDQHKQGLLSFHELERGSLSRVEAEQLCRLLRKYSAISR